VWYFVLTVKPTMTEGVWVSWASKDACASQGSLVTGRHEVPGHKEEQGLLPNSDHSRLGRIGGPRWQVTEGGLRENE
jgi:hypothetical protein